jgi:hypothetical protein
LDPRLSRAELVARLLGRKNQGLLEDKKKIKDFSRTRQVFRQANGALPWHSPG